MNRGVKTLLLAVVVLLVSVSSHAGVLGGLQLGARAGSYTDGDNFFLGVDAKFQIPVFSANPSIEYVFIDGGDLMTFNADVLMSVLKLPLVSGFLGGGIGLMYFSPDQGDSATDPLINVIAGAELGVVLNPYLMLKWVFADQYDGFVVGIGVRF